MKVRVVTLNLWGDRAPLDARLAVAAAELTALDPDVVLLQEIRADRRLGNTASTLRYRLGGAYELVYGCATRGEAGTWGPGSEAGEEGLAVLTRLPVRRVWRQVLPEARVGDTRLLLSVALGGAPVPLFVHTTHLHWRLGDGVAREEQVQAVDALARASADELAADGAVHVVGGDFNAAPDCDEIRFMTGKHTLAGRRAVWQDAFARVRPGEAGHTWSSTNPSTEWLSWLALDRRIDYVFVSPERRGGRGKVVDARVCFDRPGPDGVYASDHFGVVADIDLGVVG